MKNKIRFFTIFIMCFFTASCTGTVPSSPTDVPRSTKTPEPTETREPTPTSTTLPTLTPTAVKDPATQLMEMQTLLEKSMRQPDFVDLQYGTFEGEALLLDIYLPHQGERPFPVIIAFHGGGWDLWNKRMLEPWYYQFLDQGYALASIEYTLSDKAKWPEQGKQVNAGVRWLRANAGEFGLDPDKFIVVGGSAGGHLAGIVGTTSDIVEFNSAAYGDNNISSRVSGVITYYAAFDLSKDAKHPLSKAAKLLGCSSETCPDLAKNASVTTHVTPDDPPFYILHGTGDTVVSSYQAEEMQETLLRSNVDVTLMILDGYAHGDKRFGDSKIMEGVFAFVKRVFSE
jgi:acetyl esterase/lipase